MQYVILPITINPTILSVAKEEFVWEWTPATILTTISIALAALTGICIPIIREKITQRRTKRETKEQENLEAVEYLRLENEKYYELISMVEEQFGAEGKELIDRLNRKYEYRFNKYNFLKNRR